MTRTTRIALVIIVVILGFSLWALLPFNGDRFGRKGLRLGLDLVGGVYLVYQADISQNVTTENLAANMDRAVITIQNRIDKFGVTEPVVQKMGDDRISVQLPGFTDIDAAKSLVEQTGFLEFRQVELNSSGQPVYLNDYLQQSQLQFLDTQETGDRIFVLETRDKEGKPVYDTIGFLKLDNGVPRLFDPSGAATDNISTPAGAGNGISWIAARGSDGTQLTGEYLSDASPTMNQQNQPVIHIEWNGEGTSIFDQIATRLYNSGAEGTVQRRLGIFLDNSLISDPQILQPTYGGSGQIEGSFTLAEVETMANLLRSGSLPLPLVKEPLYQEKVSATLGANFIDMSWLAGIVGIALVMLFMIIYYRLPGLLSSIALVIYGCIVLAIFKLWPVTLSLAGLGGFVVSFGMAVDANILIFERLKEELRAGRTLGAAIEAGFNRAWSAIFDSNVTTVIACIILIWLASSVIASGQVMGFAITLLIGVLVSMFSAIIVTRTLLRLVIHSSLGRNMGLFRTDRGMK